MRALLLTTAVWFLGSACAIGGLPDADGGSSPAGGGGGGSAAGGGTGVTGGGPGFDCGGVPPAPDQLRACVQPTDYQPRVQQSANDTWPACISDNGVYTPIDPNITTVARVAAYEQVAALLWRRSTAPSPQDFLDARVLYAADQGLDSRVQRRADVHYPEPPDGGSCATAGVPAAFPARCAGPSTLLPVLNDAFQKGAAGTEPAVQAARIEASLLWFLYLSSLSEVMSCRASPKDCDSAWAYYAGGGQREAPKGFAQQVFMLSRETHDRAFDATLGVRCWRNLDNETGVAMDTARQLQIREQLDRALIRGVVIQVRQRLSELTCAAPARLAPRLAFIQTLGPLLDRALRERSPAKADAFRAALAASPLDGPGAVQLLSEVFDCP